MLLLHTLLCCPHVILSHLVSSHCSRSLTGNGNQSISTSSDPQDGAKWGAALLSESRHCSGYSAPQSAFLKQLPFAVVCVCVECVQCGCVCWGSVGSSLCTPAPSSSLCLCLWSCSAADKRVFPTALWQCGERRGLSHASTPHRAQHSGYRVHVWARCVCVCVCFSWSWWHLVEFHIHLMFSLDFGS